MNQPMEQWLHQFTNNPTQFMAGLNPASALQTQVGNTFAQLLGNPAGDATNNAFWEMEGKGILDAATPIFNRNLQQGADVLRQSGPRFASNTERLVGDQNVRAMQDFNLFSQNVLESGRNRQLQTLMNAGQFSIGQQQAGMPLLGQLLDTAFTAGGVTQTPTIIEKKPWWQQGLNAVGQAAGIASAFIPGSPGVTGPQGQPGMQISQPMGGQAAPGDPWGGFGLPYYGKYGGNPYR